ncbi:MAG: DUF2752 domain-containing protein [Planctomycetaceae bacterium]|nr:DUF2752 domain-containing protein [Planctomycetaceae bacterium]
MAQVDRPQSFQQRPEFRTRIWYFLVVVLVASVFCVAAAVVPDPRGFGTHEQLGLPPCLVMTWCNHRCPHCGMTTSFAWLVRGDFANAWHCNSGGPVLAGMMVITASWCLVVSVTGRWWLTDRPFERLIPLVLIFVGYLTVSWIIREYLIS